MEIHLSEKKIEKKLVYFIRKKWGKILEFIFPRKN